MPIKAKMYVESRMMRIFATFGCFKLAAVCYNKFTVKSLSSSAEEDNFPENLLESVAVIFSKVRNGFENKFQFSHQPHDCNIRRRFMLLFTVAAIRMDVSHLRSPCHWMDSI
jgi:hypothetical protein